MSDPTKVVLNYTVAGTELATTFGQLDGTLRESIGEAVVQGLSLGCGIVLLIVSWIMVKTKLTPMFVLHQTALALMVVRAALYLAYLLGPLDLLSFQYTGIFADYWGAFHLTIAVNVLYILLISSIECILVYQVHVIFRTLKSRIWKVSVVSLSAALGLAVVILYIVSITQTLLNFRSQILYGYEVYATWQTNVPFILFSVLINTTCVALVVKLCMAVKTRRVLGLRQFDAFHILLIMALQTCVIPSIMVIYNYSQALMSTVFVSLSVVIVVCNLPFSSLWAHSANNSPVPSSCLSSLFSQSTMCSDLALINKSVPSSPLTEYDRATLTGVADFSDAGSIEKILREVEHEATFEGRLR